MGFFTLCHFFGSSGSNNFAAGGTALRTNVYNMIGCFDNIQIVFDLSAVFLLFIGFYTFSHNEDFHFFPRIKRTGRCPVLFSLHS